MIFDCSASPDPINLIDLIGNGNDLPSTPTPKQKLSSTQIAEQPKLELRTRLQSVSPKKPITQMANMAFQGIDLTSEAGQVNSINWQ